MNEEPINEGMQESSSSILGRELRIEGKKVQTADYVLFEELLPTLEEEKYILVFSKEVGPYYNEDQKGRTAHGIDPEFDADVQIQNNDGTTFNAKDSFSKYSRTDLEEPMSKKKIRMDHTVFNSAYFPFNSGSKDTTEQLKQIEITRSSQFRQKNPDSAFDYEVRTSAIKETFSLSFDGFRYIFYKIANEDGSEQVKLEIRELKSIDGKIEENTIKGATPLSEFNANAFDRMKDSVNRAVERAKTNKS